MKSKFLMVAIFAAMFSTTVSAQKLTYGAKVGLNISSLSESFPSEWGTPEDYKSLSGVTFGLTAEYSLGDKSAISLDLLYSQQGGKLKESYSDADYSEDETYKYKYSYLNIPILYNYYILDKLAVKAGVQFGFVLSAKNTYDYSDSDGYSESGSEKMDKEYYNSTAIAIPVGLSYDITDNVFVDARYNIGVSNLSKGYDEYKMRNNNFALTVGYKF